MTEAQIQLQNALTTTFLANLAFLSEYDNELYHRVDELSRMIEDGSYQEKYALEFNMQDGDFDIYDILNDKYLYNKNPKKFNDNLVRNTELDIKNTIINIAQYFNIKTDVDIDKSKRFELNTINELNSLTYCDIQEYTKTLNDFLDQKKKRFKKIDKFIFLGTLLGRHIPRIAQKVDAKMYLVLERNLEIFRLSLFTVDYTLLAKKGVVFSVMDNYLEEENRIMKFLNTSVFDNYILKLTTTGINIDKYIDAILTTLSHLNPLTYDYNRKLYIQINRATQYLEEYRTLNFGSIKKKCNILRNTPILYLAAGPSLDDNLEWIKANQNNFFIVTIGSAYKKLINNGIKIDLITTLDEQQLLADIQFDDENVAKIDKNTIILASSITNKEVLNKFKQENLFLYEVFIPFYKNNIAFSGYSIGEVTLDILLHFNAKEIYLIGLDLALNQETGESHSKNASSVLSTLNLNEIQTREVFSESKSLIKVKGNNKDEVFTTPLFYVSIKDTEKKIRISEIKDLKIYNLSNNGAYFEGTIPTNKDDIKLKPINKEINLKSYLEENSNKSLDKDSKKSIKEELDFMDTKIKIILEDIENTDFKNYDEFCEKAISIISIVFENKYFMIYQYLYQYFILYIPYLTYHFNDSKIKNEAKQLNKIKMVFVSQMNKTLDDYIFMVKKVL